MIMERFKVVWERKHGKTPILLRAFNLRADSAWEALNLISGALGVIPEDEYLRVFVEGGKLGIPNYSRLQDRRELK